MRFLPGACFAVMFAAVSQVFFRGSAVAVLISVGAGFFVGEMVFEAEE
jgi:hypothetical protein